MTRIDLAVAEWGDRDRQWRTTVVNSLSGFRSAALLGTRSTSGRENLAIFSQVVHLGAHPPLLGIVFRPDSVERHTLSNLRETGEASLNLITAECMAAAHQTSARYPVDTSEFAATGLSPVYTRGFGAPFVAESPVRLALRYLEEHAWAVNGTVWVACAIAWAELPTPLIGDDGYIDLAAANIITTSGLDAYHAVAPPARFAYAKPNLPPRPR